MFDIENDIAIPIKVNGRFTNLTGLKFSRLTVITRKDNNKWNESMWLCKCDCGKETIVRGKSLLQHKILSCGCFRNDKIKEATEHLRVLKICLVCKKEFYVKLSHSKTEGKCCSKSCQSIDYKNKLKSINNPNYRHGKSGSKDYERSFNKQWRLNNKDKIKIINRNTKLKRKLVPGSHTLEDIKLKLHFQWNTCYWCFEPLIEYHVDHIIPISKGGSNDPDNICIACPACNLQKKDKLPEEWFNSKNYRGKRNDARAIR